MSATAWGFKVRRSVIFHPPSEFIPGYLDILSPSKGCDKKQDKYHRAKQDKTRYDKILRYF